MEKQHRQPIKNHEREYYEANIQELISKHGGEWILLDKNIVVDSDSEGHLLNVRERKERRLRQKALKMFFVPKTLEEYVESRISKEFNETELNKCPHCRLPLYYEEVLIDDDGSSISYLRTVLHCRSCSYKEY